MKFQISLRLLSLLFLGLLACLGFGQSKFFASVRPDATVVVKTHQMGTNLVEITYQGSSYPEPAIEQMLVRLGAALGNEPRNLVTTVEENVVKATFAVQGLVTESDSRLNLSALAIAMAFGDHPIKSFSVFFEGITPDKSTPKKWFAPNDAWMMEGVSMASPKGLDYRVKVNTANPNEIYMPDSKSAPIVSGKPDSTEHPNYFILGGIFVGAIAVGLLVYSALLRPRQKGR